MFVVDTNVLIVANGGKKTHANTDCQISCVNMLRSLVSEIVVIDAGGCILDEYGKYCERGGSLAMAFT